MRDQRLESALSVLRAADAHRVLDLGRGPGTLLKALMKEPGVTEVVGVDVSSRALDVAARRLHVDTMAPNQRDRLQLLQGSLTYRDRRSSGFDAAVLMEVVEHLEPERLEALERSVFAEAAPTTVIVTTPNIEYNVRFESLPSDRLRHRDHRFEWTRAEFRYGPTGSRSGTDTGFATCRWARTIRGRSADATGGVRPMSRGPGRSDPRIRRPGAERDRNEVRLPTLSLVVLVGLSGSGKSTFAARHFAPTEILSSDFCRGLVADDDNDQTVTSEAFDVLHHIAGVRLGLGRITVVDATNVQAHARKPLVELARRHHVLPVAIVLDVPERLCQERNAGRADRTFGPHVIRRQRAELRKSINRLQREGFRRVFVLKGVEAIDAAYITREPTWTIAPTNMAPSI